MRLLSCTMLVACLTGAAYADGGAPVSATPEDSAAGRLNGTYVSDRAPGEIIEVAPGPLHQIQVRCASDWEAVGWWDRDHFVGLWRRSAVPRHKDAVRFYGWLRMRGNADGSITAHFGAESDSLPEREERWKPVGPMGLPPPAATPTGRGQGSGDSLARFGEYVYVEELPVAITTVPPVYPADARSRHVQGTVMVQSLVGPEGTVRETRVVKSIPELDAAAVAAVTKWKFKPARSKGKPVSVWVAVPVKFTLP